MKITLMTVGTRGDTQLFVALAVRLKQEGHRVTLAEVGQRLQQEDGAGRAIEIFSQYVTRFRRR